MSRRPNESYLDYKKRMIDPISDSFCAAKWYNATIWLGSGTTTSCHHPPAHRIDPDEIAENPTAIHNTKHKKLMRKQMLEGDRPKECEYCWKIEDIDRNNVSDRVFKTVIYDDKEIEECNDWKTDVNLKTLEIAFDRTCNFACSYCNPSFSTTWAKDIKQAGPYTHLGSDGAGAFQQNGDWAQPFKPNEDNPYIDAFWKWWPELSKSLTELRVTGGEPLMSPEVWKLFDFFKSQETKNEMMFSINSNLGSRPEVIERLIEASQGVPKFDLYTSCEAVGAQAEYIRDGMDWDLWRSNVEAVLDRGNVRAFHMMMTINSLCLFSITDFLDIMLEWKKKYGTHKPTWSVNILRFPSFMSPLALPDHIKDDRREHIKEWIYKNKNSLYMKDMEFEGLCRLVDYLEVVDAPHRFVSDKPQLWRDFKSFFKQYDLRRGKNIKDTFPPILTDWLETVPDTEAPGRTELIDGDSTKGMHDYEELSRLAEEAGLEINVPT